MLNRPLQAADLEKGARQLLDQLDDLSVDVPKAPQQVGRTVGRVWTSPERAWLPGRALCACPIWVECCAQCVRRCALPAHIGDGRQGGTALPTL